MTTIPGWNYDKPTEKALIAEFAKTMGTDPARNMWAMLCRQLGLAQPVSRLDDLIAVSDAMIELGDTVRVAGRGARIRLITYRALHAPVLAPPDPPRSHRAPAAGRAAAPGAHR
ncbi:hypothetical protein [Actinoplanes utahensis]|uniref:Uncharacterized protein n=1 Tax=Actinoplanes utahensis TaxID=1869 RepID=A0A0A6UBW4_ACTUT|nr:hypothetical protein [Actinoplanes utahensis]KHD73545.1 hypothetical protein MB27_33995 [Actinoplanes utahensis]